MSGAEIVLGPYAFRRETRATRARLAVTLKAGGRGAEGPRGYVVTRAREGG